MPVRCVRSTFRAALFIALSALTASAQKTIHVPADQSTIQAGIDAASNGDTVLVAPGIYYENLTISRKEIVLRSSGGPEVTILDGLAKGTVIEVDHTPTLATTITGFTIRNGYGFLSADSGIYTMFAGLTVTNNIFTAFYFGAYITFGSIIFSNNIVYGTDPDPSCFFQNAGIGIYLFGISAISDGHGQVSPSLISNNSFTGPNLKESECSNGAILADNRSPLKIMNNSIIRWAGRITLLPSTYGTVTIA